MAIKIPSKNIYSIKNPKIRDNAIDNITIGYNNVAQLNEFDKPVLVDKHDIADFGYAPINKQEDLQAIVAPYTDSTTTVARAVAYVLVEPYYKSITSYIPITKDNYYVSKLLTGNDKSGNPNISYNIVGYEINGTANGNVDVGQGILVKDYKVYDLSRSTRVYGDLQSLSLPNLDEPFTQDAFANASVTQKVTASVDLDNQSTISVATATKEVIEGIEYYSITIKYLGALRITKLSGNVSKLPTNIDYTLYLSGEYTEYYPQSIEITFYGNTIGISTEDNTMTIGVGTKPLKIDGNELLQNTDDIKRKYEKPLEDYGNGKETATVLCTISDYYDYKNGQKVISPNGTNILDGNYVELWNANYNKNNGTVSQTTADNATDYLFQLQGIKDGEFTIDSIDRKTIYSSGNISLRFTKSNDFSQIRFKLNGKTIDTGISFDVSDLENGKTYFFHANVNIDGGQGSVYWDEMQVTRQARVKGYDKYGLPMAFQLYDEVVPMVMRADGEDYPLSVDASGNAKVFKVLGINIYFDGAIWQELSLQEC